MEDSDMMGVGWVWLEGSWRIAVSKIGDESVSFLNGETIKKYKVVFGPFVELPLMPMRDPTFGEGRKM